MVRVYCEEAITNILLTINVTMVRVHCEEAITNILLTIVNSIFVIASSQYTLTIVTFVTNNNEEVMLIEKMTEDSACFTIPSIGRQAELKVYLTLL